MRPFRVIICVTLLFILEVGASFRPPYGGSSAVYCNPAVIRQMQAAWEADDDGRLRDGAWEYGFVIDFAFGQIQPEDLTMGDAPRHLTIIPDGGTIAIAHVHPTNSVSQPSSVDVKGLWPDFVISKDGLWVTNPKNHTYRFLRPFNEMFLPCANK